MPKDANRDPETLLRDYLTALGRHLIYVLEQKLGAAFRTIPLEYVLTVPAIWSEVAKSKTLKACQAAGLKTDVPITLVSEPVIGMNRIVSYIAKMTIGSCCNVYSSRTKSSWSGNRG